MKLYIAPELATTNFNADIYVASSIWDGVSGGTMAGVVASMQRF